MIVLALLVAAKWWLPLTALLLGYGLLLALLIFALAMTFTDFAMREGANKVATIIKAVLLSSFITAFTGYLFLAPPPTSEMISTYRVSALLVACSYLLLMLSYGATSSPTLQSLVEIRRNIAFNRIDLASAIHQADIALSGMQVTDAIQREIGEVLMLVDRLNEATDNLLFQVNSMLANLPKPNETREAVGAKVSILAGHGSTHDTVLRYRASTLDELTQKFKQLMSRRQTIERSIPEARNFFNQLDNNVKTLLEEADKKFAIYQHQADDYRSRYSEVRKALGI